MFVTCLYLVLEPGSGALWFANAGHNLPLQLSANGPRELRATGMPLGLMPAMNYEERHARLEPGDGLLLYSDGVTEAHDSRREMFGSQRLKDLANGHREPASLIENLLQQLAGFTGPEWEQEDDVTLVSIWRESGERIS